MISNNSNKSTFPVYTLSYIPVGLFMVNQEDYII